MDDSTRVDTQTWLGLMRISCTRLCSLANSCLAKAKLNIPQFNALSIISERNEVTMSVLSRELGVTMGAGTNLMDRVVDNGLVERRRSGTDRRVVKVALTPKGKESLSQATALLMEFWSKVFAEIDPADRARFLGTYRRIFDVAEKYDTRKRPGSGPCPE